MPTFERSVTQNYQFSTAMTSGKLETVMLLLQKAHNLIRAVDVEKLADCQEQRIGAQNIIAQLEMALDYRRGASAVPLFDVYELIYGTLEHPTKKSLETADFLLSHLRNTFQMLKTGKRHLN